jgi:hypothetical protein
MSQSKTAAATTGKENGQGKKQSHRLYGRKPEEIKKDGVPILRYGKGNNFHKFKQALSEVALKEYGNLGKLINLGMYYCTMYLSFPNRLCHQE